MNTIQNIFRCLIKGVSCEIVRLRKCGKRDLKLSRFSRHLFLAYAYWKKRPYLQVENRIASPRSKKGPDFFAIQDVLRLLPIFPNPFVMSYMDIECWLREEKEDG